MNFPLALAINNSTLYAVAAVCIIVAAILYILGRRP